MRSKVTGMANRQKVPSQRTRLIFLALYLLGLCVVSKQALGAWIPPTAEKGLWFYSGLVALLLGNLLVNPFFSKPVDALSYAVAAIIALLAVNPWTSASSSGFHKFLWSCILAYLVLLLSGAIGSIVLKDSASDFSKKLSRSLYQLADFSGGPRPVCSAVFLYALFAFHQTDATEYLWIGAAWPIFIGFRPLETLYDLWAGWVAIWTTNASATRLGVVVGHQSPSIALIQEDRVSPATFGALLLTRMDDGTPGLAMAIDHVGFVDGRWLRALELSHTIPHSFARTNSQLLEATAAGDSFRIDPSELDDQLTDRIWTQRDRIVGVVATDTRLARLRTEVARTDLDLRQGALLEVQIGIQNVLYQIVDGLTREEMLLQKNTRGFVQAEAKKIGVWDEATQGFRQVPWLPQPNCPVFLVRPAQPLCSRDAIGCFPETSYPITVDEHSLVTHNAAILGILGIGKSFLALELIERMIAVGIKVICLDLTNQYASELAPHYDSVTEASELSTLEEIGPIGKTNCKKNVEEGGSICEFSTKVREQIASFLDPACERKLKILNPAKFEVWRQDSKPYANEASMATLTPTEITRIITEAALAALQDQGMSDQARCCLIYEEAHSLIPEWNAVASDGDKTATNGTAKAILQGRKYGLGCVVITQRTANVTKTILNQCNTIFALRVFDATGMEFLRNYIGEDYAGVLSHLEDRHAVVFGRASSCHDPVLIRLNDRNAFLTAFRQQPPHAVATAAGGQQ